MPTGDDGFKDYFSTQAVDYSRFRPGYPRELFAYLGSIAPTTGLAWDCATGSGQAAVALAENFDSVIATDASQRQIGSAERHPSVVYRVAPAEESGLPANSVDLITVAQALHWFDIPGFMREAQRVLVPRGVLVVWTYNLFRVSPAVDEVVDELYWNTLKGFWSDERKLVEEGYAGLGMPFDELELPRFSMSARWSLQHLLGYLSTWSAVQSYRDKRGENPLAALGTTLAQAWGKEGLQREISWPLSVKAGVRSVD
ncbi:MAG: class I SAM-dependent methyltransferase [Gammaproteobacteria bacterium]|nr:class I SAM-dependent methyltransferase [Gammaproteobacteria bacterium]